MVSAAAASPGPGDVRVVYRPGCTVAADRKGTGIVLLAQFVDEKAPLFAEAFRSAG